MAEVKNNIVTQGASGMLGDMIVFRQVNGKTIMATKPRQSEKKSEKQIEHQARFQKATIYGRSAVAKPELKSEYEAAVGEKGNSAYQVAVADFLNAPSIQEVNLSKYHGNVGDVISILVTDDFKVQRVEVEIHDPDGTLVEAGCAVAGFGVEWVYTATVKNASLAGDKITITAFDLPGNTDVEDKTL